jgi:limonene-1,2-epoxide hydrolase
MRGGELAKRQFMSASRAVQRQLAHRGGIVSRAGRLRACGESAQHRSVCRDGGVSTDINNRSKGPIMTGHGTVALATALAYHRAWTSHDFDQAMTHIAEDIVCQAPVGQLQGAEAFRGFMEPFTQILTSSHLIAAFGDETTAVLMYDTDTVPVRDAPGAECLTVADGKITHMRIIFDRLPFETVRRAAASAEPVKDE